MSIVELMVKTIPRIKRLYNLINNEKLGIIKRMIGVVVWQQHFQRKI